METFVIATNNKDKLAEMRAVLQNANRRVISLLDAGACSDPDENGTTFEENALIKARAACLATKMPAIADDSGLVVDALFGAPGIYSARYAEPGQRKSTLLKNMEGVPQSLRTARFVSAIACVFPDGRELVVRGECEGEILTQLRGSGGFGYDPLFYVPAQKATFAEMPKEIKNQISHRAKAAQKLAERLNTI